MRFDAILFDLDGTLADTLDDIAASVNWALERNALDPHPPDVLGLFLLVPDLAARQAGVA